jgi:sugar/nucleoside kinase (ribokinase family)
MKKADVYALMNQMDDEQTLIFASACSAVACSRYPFQLNPPKLSEVEQLIKRY